MQGDPGDFRGYPPGYPGYKRDKGGAALIIGIIAAALAILGAGCWWYFGYRETHPIVTEEASPEEDSTAPSITDLLPGETGAPAEAPQSHSDENGAATTAGSQTAPASAPEPPSLFNRPLRYTGTVTPGGVASLNITLFQNGRLEGAIDYSDGDSMPLFGSYTWADDGHMINLNFTVSSEADKTYSESWMGSSSYIKEDFAHTLTFKRINTSKGQSMTASFALRP